MKIENSKGLLLRLVLLSGTLFLSGCNHIVLFDPKGPVADQEISLIILAFALMLIVVVPVFIMAIWFSIKYRESNTRSTYKPQWAGSTKIELAIWMVPVLIVAVLSYHTWTKTHQLDPYKPLGIPGEEIQIEVVSMDWGWLFIYPDYDIATVNELVFPVDAPLSFRLTSSTVMTSFFIPQMGSQMYAMAGMQTRLHLMAEETGTFEGQNQEFSGKGYENMHFRVIAVTPEEFGKWVNKVHASPETLDLARFNELSMPKLNFAVTYFSSVDSDLFRYILSKFKGGYGANSK
jgi:cytochrome o ubiquinol oxidase subunit II